MSHPTDLDPRDNQLQTAFDSLRSDVATRTHARGSAAVITRVRRGRRLAVGTASLAAIALATAGVWVIRPMLDGPGAGGNETVLASDPGVVRALPKAAAWEPQNWPEELSAWGEPFLAVDSVDIEQPSCFEAIDAVETPERKYSTESMYSGNGVAVFFGEFQAFRTDVGPPEAAVTGLSECGAVTTLPYADGGVVIYVSTKTPDGRVLTLFWGQHGSASGFSLVADAVGQPVPVAAVADALMAGVLHAATQPSNMDDGEGSRPSPGPSAPARESRPFGELDLEEFGAAIKPWAPHWSTTPASFQEQPLPCLPTLGDFASGADGGSFGPVGNSGSSATAEFSGAPNVAAGQASRAEAGLVLQLLSCNATRWEGVTGIGPNGEPFGHILTSPEGTLLIASRGAMVEAVAVYGATFDPQRDDPGVMRLLWDALDPGTPSGN